MRKTELGKRNTEREKREGHTDIGEAGREGGRRRERREKEERTGEEKLSGSMAKPR